MQFEQILSELFDNKTLTREQATTLFGAIVKGELSGEQLAGVLIALKLRGETVDEISGAVTAMLQAAEPFPTPDYPLLTSSALAETEQTLSTYLPRPLLSEQVWV